MAILDITFIRGDANFYQKVRAWAASEFKIVGSN